MEYTIHTTEMVRVVTTVAPLICSTMDSREWPTAGGVIGISRAKLVGSVGCRSD